LAKTSTRLHKRGGLPGKRETEKKGKKKKEMKRDQRQEYMKKKEIGFPIELTRSGPWRVDRHD